VVVEYKINEIFLSLQGEGHNAGKAMVFVRFAGCNLKCKFCDTEYDSFKLYTLDKLVEEIQQYDCKRVLYTGGEPLLQLDLDLARRMHDLSYYQLLETNGTLSPEGLFLNYITVSPKQGAKLSLYYLSHAADEMRVLMDAEGTLQSEIMLNTFYRFVSPMFDGMKMNRKSLKHAIEFCLANHDWQLSVQQHKEWKIK
jgi:7-carboxy-7-deazaguanine synthase